MKRIISVIILLVMVAVVFSACGMGHSHKNDPWTVTPDGHYQICEKSGEKNNEGEHSVDDDNICKSCGAELAAFSPNELRITVYNQHGLIQYYAEYRVGTEVYRRVYEYAYDGDTPISYQSFLDSELYDEGKVVQEDGEFVTYRTKQYYEDSYQIRTYNEDGLLSTKTEYNMNGVVLESEEYTYEKDADGNLISCTTYFSDGFVRIEKYAKAPDGDSYVYEENEYNDNGELQSIYKYRSDGFMEEYIQYEGGSVEYTRKYEYVLDENGEMLSLKIFDDGVLGQEGIYKYAQYPFAASDTVISEWIYYDSDGGKYIDIYDDFGRTVLEKEIDPDGNTVSQIEKEYTVDEIGRVILNKEFEDGVLSEETAYEYEGLSDDWITRTETEYDSDGGKTVTQYNENYDTLSQIEYDAAGTVVYSETYEYEYDENGNLVNEKAYADGVLVEERKHTYDERGNDLTTEIYEYGVLTEKRTFSIGKRGYSYESNCVWYYDDGGTRSIDYDETGDITLDVEYDADGNYIHYFKYTTVTNDDGSTVTYIYDENDWLMYEDYRDASNNHVKWIAYYQDGSRYEADYYEDGQNKSIRDYDANGVLVSEVIYNSDGDVVTETQYVDGKTVVYTHNGDGTITCEVFDSNGNLISSETV